MVEVEAKKAIAIVILVFVTVFGISYFQEYPIFPSLPPIWRILVDSVLVTAIIVFLTIIGNQVLYKLTD